MREYEIVFIVKFGIVAGKTYTLIYQNDVGLCVKLFFFVWPSNKTKGFYILTGEKVKKTAIFGEGRNSVFISIIFNYRYSEMTMADNKRLIRRIYRIHEIA